MDGPPDRAIRSDRYDRFVTSVTETCRSRPGQRSALRRSLRRPPEQAYTAHAIVAPWLPSNPCLAQEWAYYAVAAMIAAQPRASDQDTAAVSDDPPDGDPAAATGPQAATAERDGRTAVAPAGAPAPAEAAVPSPVRVTDGDSRLGDRPNLGAALAAAVVGRGGTADRGLHRETAEKRLHLLVRQDLTGLHRHLPGVVRHLGALRVPVDWARLLTDLSRWATYRDDVAKAWLQSFYQIVNSEPNDTDQEAQ